MMTKDVREVVKMLTAMHIKIINKRPRLAYRRRWSKRGTLMKRNAQFANMWRMV